MNFRSLGKLSVLGIVLFSAVLSRGQILDGHLVVDTPYYVSVITGYPLDAIRQVIPQGSVTSITNGNLLAGTGLSTPEPVTLGIPAIGNIHLTWEYSAVPMADGSGTAIFLDITAIPAVLGQSVPTTGRYIVARPDQVHELFKDRNAVISQVLQQMYLYYYYTGGSGGGSTPSSGSLYSLNPYTYWYAFNPNQGIVKIGPPVFIGF